MAWAGSLAPYNHQYVEGGWRGYWDFDSGARLLDWGAHTVDLCQWANAADDTGPVEYEASGKTINARYANGVKLVIDCLETPFGQRPGWVQSLGTCPVRFVGDEGWVETGDNGGIEVHPAPLKEELKGVLAKREVGLDVSAHARNFFDCIKSRAKPAANSQVMRHSHIACHAAALAWILKRSSHGTRSKRNSSATTRPTVFARVRRALRGRYNAGLMKRGTGTATNSACALA